MWKASRVNTPVLFSHYKKNNFYIFSHLRHNLLTILLYTECTITKQELIV